MEEIEFPNSFEFVSVPVEGKDVENSMSIKIAIKNRTEFKDWLNELSMKNNICWRKNRGDREGKRKLELSYVCHHAKLGQKGVMTTSTNCPARLRAIIETGESTPHPCCITFTGCHNHSLFSPAILSQFRMSASTKEEFYFYFEQGMLAAQARRHHQLKLNFQNDVALLANRRVNPSLHSVVSLRARWRTQNRGKFENISVLDAMQRTKTKMPQHLINFAETPGGYVAVLVTDFMYRIHKEIQSASEVVFVDTTSPVDKTNCSLTLLVCSSAAGALPLGVILSSTQTKEDYVRGFSLLQDILGDVAFNGKLSPECFITDDSDAERDALRDVWPDSKLFLCSFHVLQAAWRWLWNDKNAIAKKHRQPLILVLKKLVYAESIGSFDYTWSEFLQSELSRNNFSCTEYYESAVERREEWSLPWRCGSSLRGHNTNNMCESMMTVIKDIALNRNQIHNGAQLLVVMADVYNSYLRLRLSDVIFKNDISSKAATSTIPLSAVTHDEGTVYRVNSDSQEGNEYIVDLSIGTCSCTSENAGRVCKHQVSASQYSAVRLPQLHTFTAAEKLSFWTVLCSDTAMPASTVFVFDGIFVDMPSNAVSHVNEQITASDQGDRVAGTKQVIETSTPS